ncbi:MAG: M23 family metallopeptidase [Spirochaetia bacterium]|jgi:murein DD-endopeptidase MepM/ murein hydrolase activator NlpD|nr:M23 family metallopeptidase [Spirochaetia bacterium]
MVLARLFFTVLILFLFTAFAYPEYPAITSLDSNDYIFRQITSDITSSYMMNSSGSDKIPLSIYRYQPGTKENLFMIASRLNLPYEAITTLNRISSIGEFNNKNEILIPNQPVLFIPDNPSGDIEFLLSARDYDHSNDIFINIAGKKTRFTYIIDGRLNNTERAFFLDTFFRFPLEKGRISSYYGMRLSPITGEPLFHPGIDIAAPEGTPVFSSGKGVVTLSGFDKVLGNYIIIKHPGTYQSVYGHLKKSFVKSGSTVNAGTVIGEVGSTGYSTGPHLHFEVRGRNKAEDPLILINRKK